MKQITMPLEEYEQLKANHAAYLVREKADILKQKDKISKGINRLQKIKKEIHEKQKKGMFLEKFVEIKIPVDYRMYQDGFYPSSPTNTTKHSWSDGAKQIQDLTEKVSNLEETKKDLEESLCESLTECRDMYSEKVTLLHMTSREFKKWKREQKDG